jgi:hypothetical protein
VIVTLTPVKVPYLGLNGLLLRLKVVLGDAVATAVVLVVPLVQVVAPADRGVPARHDLLLRQELLLRQLPQLRLTRAESLTSGVGPGQGRGRISRTPLQGGIGRVGGGRVLELIL